MTYHAVFYACLREYHITKAFSIDNVSLLIIAIKSAFEPYGWFADFFSYCKSAFGLYGWFADFFSYCKSAFEPYGCLC